MDMPSATRLARRLAAAAFATTFIALALSPALPGNHPVRRTLRPLSRKAEPLRLFSPWRMFVGRAQFGFVNIEGLRDDGERIMVESLRHEDKSWFEQLRDRRIRKLHGKLKRSKARRRWGHHYLTYVCRHYRQRDPGLRQLEVVVGKPRRENDEGTRSWPPTRRVLMRHDCDRDAVGPERRG